LQLRAVPEHLRIAAIVFAMVSVVLLAVAVRQWSAPPSEGGSDARARNRWQGNLLLFLLSIGLVVSVLLAAELAGWNRDRALWISVGSLLGLLTLLRPWWFWENYRARWLRNLIGDEATMVVYLGIAAIMVWVGLNTDWTFGRR
jgi:hypothetical protein